MIGAREDSTVTVLNRQGADPGYAAIPRWATGDIGTAEHRFALPNPVTELAAAYGADLDAVLLAVHAVVVGALSGEPVVGVGNSAGSRVVELTNRTWRELIAEVRYARAGSGRCDTVLASAAEYVGAGSGSAELGDAAADPIVHIGLDGDMLVLCCRREWVDDDYAARIADYHRTALRLAAADPDAVAADQCLLGDAELGQQLTAFSDLPRDLPDRRAHQLFADTAAARPDDVAVRCGLDRLSYRQLDERANQVAHALLRDGLCHEDVVAVVAERGIPWLVGTLGVLKAGGCYLPVEPQFPAARIVAMFASAECRFALTDEVGSGVFERLVGAVPAIRARTVQELFDESLPTTDPDVPVAAGQLAYIYFTSGSTGEPKGVLCEQEGMLNHMLAKLDDLDVTAGTVVAQTAPQCFDISLWQLLAPLLVGGTVVIVAQQAVLDIEQFVTELARHRVEVAQLVPSYVEILLDHLRQGTAALPALRCVSATGEALRAALVRRWFAVLPDVRLVNAYGLTETCDDTNHEPMTAPPAGPHVPLGRAIPGVGVQVVDRNLLPVPLGAVGEIVFSGRCIARGYCGDPARTALAFPANPLRRGERLYRSGDFGKWAPDGRLEFAGRRDTQVKIRGFRIEIAEIEDRLLRVPQLREAAVIVAGAGDTARLVACYAAPPSLPPGSLVEELSRALPDYMVPMDWYWFDALPLTGNGKVDRAELAAVVGGLRRSRTEEERPRTDTERRLAAGWATALGVAPERVGRTDDFFASGGSSLTALRLVIALDQAISLGDITGHPVLADLAEVLDTAAGRARPVLYRLTPPGQHILVCFPYAGGNAMAYLPLADELGTAGWAVYGVEPPGRDGVTAALSVPELAERVAAELADLAPGPLTLWGHSMGVAVALETARLLVSRGHDVRGVYLGAQLPGTAAARRDQAAEVRTLTDRQVLDTLILETGKTELAALRGTQRQLLAEAYRHDVAAACRYLADALEAGQPRLDVPVTVVLAADDPELGRHLPEDDRDTDAAEWTGLVGEVRMVELADGGHYFPAARPATIARLVAGQTG